MRLIEGDGTNPLPVSAHKIITHDPVIASATWSTYDGSNGWTDGSILNDLAAAEHTETVPATPNEWTCWDVSEMAEDWRTGNNYGVAFVPGTGDADSYRYFSSAETAYDPVLIYTTGVGVGGGRATVVTAAGGMRAVKNANGMTIK